MARPKKWDRCKRSLSTIYVSRENDRWLETFILDNREYTPNESQAIDYIISHYRAMKDNIEDMVYKSELQRETIERLTKKNLELEALITALQEKIDDLNSRESSDFTPSSSSKKHSARLGEET